MPCVMSHISCVQTLVNANGKNRSNVFFFPKLPPSFTSTRPEACLDLRLKSGALVPTDRGIVFWIFGFRFLSTPTVILFWLRTCQTTITGSKPDGITGGEADGFSTCFLLSV